MENTKKHLFITYLSFSLMSIFLTMYMYVHKEMSVAAIFVTLFGLFTILVFDQINKIKLKWLYMLIYIGIVFLAAPLESLLREPTIDIFRFWFLVVLFILIIVGTIIKHYKKKG